MNYIIYQDGKEVNRIVADEAFCRRYYSGDGYSYEEEAPADTSPDIGQHRTAKLQEVGGECTAAIYAGIDMGGAHYSLTEHDQMEIMAQYTTVKDGAQAVPYHADGELCRMYPAEEFAALAQAATAHVFYHRTYCNHLNAWIRRADAEELADIAYGVELPADLAESMAALLATAGGTGDA